MVNFIELHKKNGDPIAVNIENVIYIDDDPDGGAYLQFVLGWKSVAESYDEVMTRIKDAGQNFVKKDPRIAYTRLTWSELCGMVGQPVWGENQQRWYIVAAYDDKTDEIELSGTSLAATIYTEEELIKRPLYPVKGGKA